MPRSRHTVPHLPEAAFGSSVLPPCPACPSGLFPDGLRNDLVRRMISAFIGSFEGGVPLLPGVIGGSSCLDRSRWSSPFSFFLPECLSKRPDFLESDPARPVNLTNGHILRIDGPLMSLTCCFTGIKMKKLSDPTNYKHIFFE